MTEEQPPAQAQRLVAHACVVNAKPSPKPETEQPVKPEEHADGPRNS